MKHLKDLVAKKIRGVKIAGLASLALLLGQVSCIFCGAAFAAENPVHLPQKGDSLKEALRKLAGAFERVPESWTEENLEISFERWRGVTCSTWIAGEPRSIGLTLGEGFSGRLPEELGDVPKVVSLELEDNELSGALPQSVAKWDYILTVSVKNCPRLGNDFIESLVHLSSPEDLTYLTLQGLSATELSGVIGNFPALQMLELIDMPITELPDEIGNLSNLTRLVIENCPVKTLPDRLADCSNMRSIEIRNAALTEIPSALKSFRKLTGLTIADCGIEAPFPEFVTDFPLTELDLGGNKLTGRLPESIGKLADLRRLCLENNNLEGPVPACIAGMKLELFRMENSGLSSEGMAEKMAAIEERNDLRFLWYKDAPAGDDSSYPGPAIELYGVPKSVRLSSGGSLYESAEVRSTYWGDVQKFRLAIDTNGVDIEHDDLAKLEPAINKALEEIEKYSLDDIKHFLIGPWENGYDLYADFEEYVADQLSMYPNLDLQLPPREAFSSIFYLTDVCPFFVLDENGVRESTIELHLYCPEKYYGPTFFHVYIKNGELSHEYD